MDVKGLIEQSIAFQKKEEAWRLGFFSKPFLCNEGEHKGKIIKIYKAVKDTAFSKEIIKQHEQYVNDLRNRGVKVPKTNIQRANYQDKEYLIIIQDAFSTENLLRNKMIASSDDQYLELLKGILNATLEFIEQNGKDSQVGFHPTLRNYAVNDDTYHYFDSFPPMSHGQKEVERLVLAFAPYKLPFFLKWIAKPFLHLVADEYYQYDKMLSGIVGSACRLRPALAEKIISFSRSHLEDQIKDDLLKAQTLKRIQKPPELPKIWVFMRKLFGKEGKPNLKQ